MALYSLFAEILGYPECPIGKAVSDCMAELVPEFSAAHVHIADFQNAVAGRSLGQLQETYTNAFDLRPDCTPNLGYHLFGDDGRRGLFLAELKRRMEARGIPLGFELPDHISLLLRYMHAAEQERSPLIEDCMLPAVSRMVEILDSTENPYKHVLRALLSLLQYQQEASSAQTEAMEV
ncbi:MAG: nitrate reductase molybdenum cofactor assembly chaperone [Bryobacteraceae bacterium]|jgi:nitrate reductase molybdenum cofactor assembly chaperone NarJ/NarW